MIYKVGTRNSCPIKAFATYLDSGDGGVTSLHRKDTYYVRPRK